MSRQRASRAERITAATAMCVLGLALAIAVVLYLMRIIGSGAPVLILSCGGLITAVIALRAYSPSKK